VFKLVIDIIISELKEMDEPIIEEDGVVKENGADGAGSGV
jgi:hypothetical protein